MKIKKLLAVVLLIITLLSSVTFLDVINVKASGNYTLAQLQAKYPNGKYWNGGDPESYTSTPCNHHGKGICTYSGSCGCNSYRGLASQCMGFAYQLASLVYGGNPYSEWTANRNVSALDSVKPGDVIRYNNNGHSIFVTNVSGDVITYADCNGGGLNNCLIAWNRTKTKSEIKKTFSYVDQAPYAWENNSTSGTTNVNITSCPDKNTITNTNAILWGQVNKPSSYAVTQIGIKVRKSDSTYDNGWSKYEAPSWDYVGETFVQPYYNLNTELSLTLSPGTDYYYKIYAKVNGTEYWSAETKFTTIGTHTHNYTIHEYEAAHPHKYYKKCSCGDYYYTGETEYLSNCSTCTNHECDKGEYLWSWDAHPHHSCYECSICGEVWADKSSSNLIDSCSECYPVGKSTVTIDKEQYDVGNSIEISWSEAERATHYNLWIHKKDSDGSYDTVVIREDSLTTNSYTARGLSEGEYRIYIYSYDSTRYMPDQSDWSHQESEPVDFKICTFARYYDWTFNFDNAMKMLSDAMVSDGDLNLAFQEYNKGFIGEVDIYADGVINHLDEPYRPGYRFTGWKTLLVPNQSVYAVSYTHYIFQAQYEPLLYSKGECLYGDINFDGEVNILDLVRIKKIMVGVSEDHISADLDGDASTNALDISLLRKLLLGIAISKNVYFDANGGTVSEAQRLVVCGQSLGDLPIPTRTGYDFVGWYTSDGTEITSDIIMTADKEITAIAHWSAKSYKINWNTGTGYTITVKRTSSPYANASIGTLNNEASIYYGDVLNISYSATAGYSLKSNGITSATVIGDITSADVYATASVNSYTYNIVYKSSNGTSLGTATAKYNYGTTNTISPKSFTGYNTPSSQSVKWDSTSAKTITFTYSPVSVSTSQHLSSGAWAIDGSTNYITYSVKAEYRNRTASSIQVRVVWTNTLIANYYYQRGQVFNATIGGKGTGNVTIVPYNTWASSTSSNRSLSGTSAWITVPVSATQTSISISADAYRQHSDGSLVNINESFSKTFNIPTY